MLGSRSSSHGRRAPGRPLPPLPDPSGEAAVDEGPAVDLEALNDPARFHQELRKLVGEARPRARHEQRPLGERLALLPKDERARILAELSEGEAWRMLYDWRGMWARPEQLPPPGDWTTWAVFSGRGSGKTRLAAEFITEEVEAGRAGHVHLVGADAGDVRDVIVEGESGILAVSPPWFRPKYEPSKRRLTWPNGATASTFGAHDPDALRGPQSDLAWCDEIAKWKYAQEAYDNLVLGNRLGRHPRRIVTSTPKPIKLVRHLMGRERGALKDPTVVLAPRMSTYDNLANLAPSFIREILTKYQGTRLGRQELMGELLLDMPGALWTLAMFDRAGFRVTPDRYAQDVARSIDRVVVAIDPAVTSGEESDETGIVAAARDRRSPPHFYVLRDYSGRLRAFEWARRAVNAFRELGADRILGEVNNGGDLIEVQIRVVDPNASYRAVWASRGKRTRGEPVAALYEQRRVHHVGAFDQLEDQMITWVPDAGDDSPNRVDALVWALTDLMRGSESRDRGGRGTVAV